MTDSNEILDLIFAATNQIFYNYDVATGAIAWSGQIEKVLGFQPGELSGGVEQWVALIHPNDRDQALHQLEIAEKQVSSYEVEYRFQRKDGTYAWMRDRGIYKADETGKAVRMVGVQEDINDRKLADQTIRATDDRLRAVVTVGYELMRTPDLDSLYRGMVDLAHKKLGVERCGLFILDDAGEFLAGMYGTDDEGNTIDQRAEANTIPVTNQLEHDLLFTPRERLWTIFNKERLVLKDGQLQGMGQGWNVATVLQGPTGPRGIFYNDAAISNAPYDETLQETIALYCSMVGNIIENKRLMQNISQSLEKQDQRVQISTIVAQEIAAARDINTLFQQVVTLVKERFHYYHAQLLRYDPAQDAVALVAGYGKTGAKMLKAGHKLPMGKGLIGTAAATGQTVMRSNLANDPDWQPNPLLPETRGEIAVPIKLQNKVLGVLDVQSARADALTDEDRLLLEGLCGQIAIAINSIRLLEDATLYRQLVEQARQGVGFSELNGTLLFANQPLAEMFGATKPSEIVGESIYNFYPPDEQAKLAGEVLSTVTQTGSWAGEISICSVTGENIIPTLNNIFLVRDIEGNPRYIANIITDITQRKQAEESLQKSEAQLSDALKIARLGHWEYDFGTDTFTFNDNFYAVFRTTVEEVGGYQMSSEEYAKRFVHPDDVPMVGAEIGQAIAYTGPHYTTRVEHRAIFPNGEIGHIQVNINVERDEAGQITRWYGANQDITERKRAELAVRESEAQLSNALKIARLGYWEYNFDKDTFTFNDNFYGVFRTTVDDVGGYQMSSAEYVKRFVHPDDAHMVGDEIGRGFSDPRQHFNTQVEHRVIFPGSEIGYVSVNITVEKDEAGKMLRVYGANQDITERRQVQENIERLVEERTEQLRESQQLLQLIMDNIPQAVFWKNKDLVYLGANQAFAKDAGFNSANELTGKTDFDMPWVEQAELYRADDRQVIADGVVKLNYEEPQTSPANEITWLRTSKIPVRDEKGNVIAVLGMYEDITEQKQAQELLRQNEERFRTVADFTYDWEYWLAPDGNFQYISPSCERVSGYTPEAFQQDPRLLSKIIQPEDQDAWQAHIEHYHTESSNQVGELEFRITTKDGDTRWISHICQAVHGQDGIWLGRRASNRDVTESKRLEIQVQNTLQRRGRQVQLSTQFAQNIAAATTLNHLYRQVVNDVKEQFGFYHVQLLRYEPALDAVALVVGYGEIGQKMLVAGHKLPMGSGLIGVAAATGDTMLRPDLTDDLAWQPNPLLPETKGEIAVPIKLGQRVLGVLDVQSSQRGALGAEDQQLLEGLCGQIAVAIEQTRLRTEMEERLNEINTLYRTVSGQGWQAFQNSGEFARSYRFDRLDVKPDEIIWADALNEVYTHGHVVHAEAPQPVTVAPLTVRGGNVVGALGVVEDPNRPLAADERVLLEQVSEQLALALDSARLFSQTQASLAETQILNEISVRLNAAMTLDDVLEATISYSTNMRASSAGIWLIESDEQGKPHTMEFMSTWVREGSSRLPIHTRLKIEQFPSSKIWLNDAGQPTYINNTQTDPRLDDALRATFAATKIQAAAFMPLVVAGRWLGVTIVSWDDPHEFSDREKIVFASIAGQTVVKIENQQLLQRTQAALEETRRRTQEMSVLNEMGRTLTSLREVESIAEVIYEYTSRLMEADTFFVAMYDDANDVISFPLLVEAGKRVNLPPQQLAGGLTEYIIHTKQPLLLSDHVLERMEELGLENIILGETTPTKSWMGVPMIYADQVIGVISVQSPTKEGLYKEFDRDLLTAIASQSAISIENARIFQRTERQAEYEALINTISQRIQGTTSVESALQVAVRELGRALGASRASVQLGVTKRKV